MFRNNWRGMFKSSSCWAYLQVPQISIRSTICGMCWNNKSNLLQFHRCPYRTYTILEPHTTGHLKTYCRVHVSVSWSSFVDTQLFNSILDRWSYFFAYKDRDGHAESLTSLSLFYFYVSLPFLSLSWCRAQSTRRPMQRWRWRKSIERSFGSRPRYVWTTREGKQKKLRGGKFEIEEGGRGGKARVRQGKSQKISLILHYYQKNIHCYYIVFTTSLFVDQTSYRSQNVANNQENLPKYSVSKVK